MIKEIKALIAYTISGWKEQFNSPETVIPVKPIEELSLEVSLDLENAKSSVGSNYIEVSILFNSKTNEWNLPIGFENGKPIYGPNRENSELEWEIIREFERRAKYIPYYYDPYVFYVGKNPVLHLPIKLPSKQELDSIRNKIQILVNQICWEKTVRDAKLEQLKNLK